MVPAQFLHTLEEFIHHFEWMTDRENFDGVKTLRPGQTRHHPYDLHVQPNNCSLTRDARLWQTQIAKELSERRLCVG